jgi:hypothetical protein
MTGGSEGGGYCQSGIRFSPQAEQHYGGILVVNRKAGQRNAISATIAELIAQTSYIVSTAGGKIRSLRQGCI